MRKISLALALVASLFTLPAYADFTGKDASAATITFKNPATCSSVVCVPVFQIYDGTNVVTLTTAGADAVSNTLTGVPMYGRNLVYNGSTWDRWTGAVTVASLPLPTGAATSALQTTGNTSLATIATNSGTQATAANQSTGNTSLASIVTNTTGIATAANQTTANTSLATIATNTGAAIPAQTTNTVNIGAVMNAGSKYIAVAASQTATVLQSSTGAAGDYLSHCTIYPTSTSPGVVTVFDSTNTAANSAILFPGGASSLSNLVPFAIPVGAVSVNGAWKVTTGSGVSVVCEGKFS